MHGATNVRIFGSVVRDEAGAQSDVDVLVDLELGRSLFDLGGLLMDLQDILGRRVDVVTEGALALAYSGTACSKRPCLYEGPTDSTSFTI